MMMMQTETPPPDELQEALKDGRLGLTQGYLFSDYPDNPDLLRIFIDLLTTPVANDKLKAQLEAYRKATAPRTSRRVPAVPGNPHQHQARRRDHRRTTAGVIC
jgi:hypothetical protein